MNGSSVAHTNGLDLPGSEAGEGVVAPDPELETLRCQLQDLQLVLQRKDETLYQLHQQQSTEQSQRSYAVEDSKQVILNRSFLFSIIWSNIQHLYQLPNSNMFLHRNDAYRRLAIQYTKYFLAFVS